MSNVRGQTDEQLARKLAPPEELKLIITGETSEAIQTLIEVAEKIGQYLVEKSVTTSQIRNIFGTARMIEQEVKTLEDDKPLPIRVQRDLQMLRPKLAYQYGRIQKRDEKEGMGALTGILSEAIALVGSDVRRFRNFMDFFEAILAYHRRYGGTNRKGAYAVWLSDLSLSTVASFCAPISNCSLGCTSAARLPGWRSAV